MRGSSARSPASLTASSNRPVMFFSENLASLLDVAKDVTDVHILTTVDGTTMREQVDYRW